MHKDISGGNFKPLYAHILKYNKNYSTIDGYVDLNGENTFARFTPAGYAGATEYAIGPLYVHEYTSSIYPPGTNESGTNEARPEQLIREQYINYNGQYTGDNPGNECCIQKDPALDCKKADLANDEGSSCLLGAQNTGEPAVSVRGSFNVVLYSRSYSGKGEATCIISDKDILGVGIRYLVGGNKRIYKFAIIPRGL